MVVMVGPVVGIEDAVRMRIDQGGGGDAER